jgi:hypothetical protein
VLQVVDPLARAVERYPGSPELLRVVAGAEPEFQPPVEEPTGLGDVPG